MSDLGQIYALHPTEAMTALQLAAAYGLNEGDYVVMEHSDFSNPAYIHLTERDDNTYFKKEALWGDDGDTTTSTVEGLEGKKTYKKRVERGEYDNPQTPTPGYRVGIQ